MAKAPIEPDFDLKQQRPSAGEVRRFATGQALFLAPLPLPTGHAAMDLGGSFLQVNDTYLDVGQSNFNAQFMIWGALCIPNIWAQGRARQCCAQFVQQALGLRYSERQI